MIDRVGGLLNYRLLEQDRDLYDLFVAAMLGEADARRVAKTEADVKAKSRTRT